MPTDDAPPSLLTGARWARPLVTRDTFIGIVWTLTALSFLGLAFRYFVRIRSFKRLQLDDFLTGFAWSLLLATAILWTAIIDKLYYMEHVLAGMLPPDDLPRLFSAYTAYLHGSLGVLLMFYVGLWAIKIGFLVFFKRLGDRVRFYRIYWWAITVVTVVAGVACIGDIQYGCLAVPVQETLVKCAGPAAIRFQDTTLKVNCALDVLTDVLIVSLPISILWNVRMSITRKLQLTGLLSLVVITMATSIIRVTLVSSKSTLSTSKQLGISWLYLWHFIESAIALLVACLASFRTLFTTRSSREELAQRRDEEALRNAEPQRKHVRARAKYYEDSLFEAPGEGDEIGRVDSGRENDAESPLSDDCSQHHRDGRVFR